MDIRQGIKNKTRNFRFFYTVISITLFCAQFVYFYFRSSFGMPTLMRNQNGIFHQYILSSKLVFEFSLFIFAQVLVAFIFFRLLYWVIQKNKEIFCLARRGEFFLGFGILFSAVATVLLANNYFFQFSKFAFWFYGSAHSGASFFVFLLFASVTLLFLVLALAVSLKNIVAGRYVFKKWYALTAAILLIGIGLPVGWSMASKSHNSINNKNPSNKPNIIIIGIDSLRPDYVAALDANGRQFVTGQKTITPNVDQILHGASIVSNSYTPIARTFPAWVSILTGEYPDQNGIYFNLMDPKNLDQNALLTHTLKKLGYYMVFGMDDRRFSNIDQRYGFDAIIGPHEGMNDFLLGALNDFPLTNLLINSKVGSVLFPYSYGNRSGAITYDPASFDDLISERIAKLNHQPLFLAVHFCLPHWPYYWAVTHPQHGPYLKGANLQFVYEQGIIRADQQVGDFWHLLQARGLLNNAIVIVLSDHGESLLSFDTRLFVENKFNPGETRTKNLFKVRFKKNLYGHGAYLSTLFENHNVLAFRVFGPQPNKPGRIETLASLIDIKPTILGLLKQDSTKTSGISFADQVMQGEKSQVNNRGIMMQTGLNVMNLKNEQVPVQKLLDKSLNFYQVNPKTGLVTLQQSYIPGLIKSKARSIRYQNWYLVVFPASYFPNQKYRTPRAALLNLQTGEWTDNLASQFARAAPLQTMLGQMKALFGRHIDLDFPELKKA